MTNQFIAMNFEDGEPTGDLVWNSEDQSVFFPSIEAASDGIEDEIEDDERQKDDCFEYRIFKLVDVTL